LFAINRMEAIIVKQTLTQVKILCPYCSKIHIHGKVNSNEYRTSHCHKGDYLIKKSINQSL